MADGEHRAKPALPGLIERIDLRKRALGLTSDQALCKAAGLDPDYLRATVRRNREPGAAKLLALAKALQCSVSYLIAGDAVEGSPEFDEMRLLDVVKAVVAFASDRPGALTNEAFAELVLHLYRLEIENRGDGSITRRLLNQR